MAQRFSSLPDEKQQQILDAAAEVFSREDYKRASTDDIAARAGISKGLLFYYFKNKQSLYLYVADHMRHLVERHLERGKVAEITDFFDMLDYGAQEKLQLFQQGLAALAVLGGNRQRMGKGIRQFSAGLNLSLRLYYATDKDVVSSLRQRFMEMLDEMWDVYFSQIDREKFRPGIEPRLVLDQLIYLIDGYIHQQMMRSKRVNMDALMAEYALWRDMLRQYAYKEEYQ